MYPSAWDKATWDEAYAANFEGPIELIEQLHPHMAEGDHAETGAAVQNSLGSIDQSLNAADSMLLHSTDWIHDCTGVCIVKVASKLVQAMQQLPHQGFAQKLPLH